MRNFIISLVATLLAMGGQLSLTKRASALATKTETGNTL